DSCRREMRPRFASARRCERAPRIRGMVIVSSIARRLACAPGRRLYPLRADDNHKECIMHRRPVASGSALWKQRTLKPHSLIATLIGIAMTTLIPFARADLFVGSRLSNTIFRYDEVTGAPLPSPGNTEATFVPVGSGGLDSPRGLLLGPDGNLYVNS